MTKPAFERREFLRVEITVPVQFRMIDEKTSEARTDWIVGTIINVSKGGLKVVAPIPHTLVELFLDMHVNIECSFQLPDTPTAIIPSAEIVYFLPGMTTDKTTMVTFGLSFVTIDESTKDAIDKFIIHRNTTTSSPEGMS